MLTMSRNKTGHCCRGHLKKPAIQGSGHLWPAPEILQLHVFLKACSTVMC